MCCKSHLISWWIGRHNRLAEGRQLLCLLQHVPQLGIPAWHEAHVRVNLQVQVLPSPQLLCQVAGLTGAGGFLPGNPHLPHLRCSLPRSPANKSACGLSVCVITCSQFPDVQWHGCSYSETSVALQFVTSLNMYLCRRKGKERQRR